MADGGKILKQDIIEQKPIEDALKSMATLVEDITTKIKTLGDASKTAFEHIKNAGDLKGLANQNKNATKNAQEQTLAEKEYIKLQKQVEVLLARQTEYYKHLNKEKQGLLVNQTKLNQSAKEEITNTKANAAALKKQSIETKQQEAATKLLIKAKNTQAGSVERLRAVNAMYANRMKQLNVLIPAQRAQYDRLSKSMANINTRIGDMSGKAGGLKGIFGNLIKSIGSYLLAMVAVQRIVQFFTRDLLDMTKKLDSLEFSMKTVMKTQEEVADTQLFLSHTAQNYGQDILTLTERYIKFRAATMQSNMSVRDTQKIFNSLAKAAAVLGLKTDELNGVFLAIEQMVSKGKVTTEELRRQLGERLPGAMGIMADAIGVSIVELDKMLKAGSVLSSDALPKFAVALEKAYGIESVKKIDTLAAAQGRLKTSWVEFVRELKASNYYISVLDNLADAINNIQYQFGKTTELEHYTKTMGIGGDKIRETIEILDKFTDVGQSKFKDMSKYSKIWVDNMKTTGIDEGLSLKIFKQYVEERKKLIKQNTFTPTKLKPLDVEEYSKELDNLKKDTESFQNTNDTFLKKEIIDSNKFMTEKVTDYKEILKLQEKELANSQRLWQIQLDQYEQMKTVGELSKSDADGYKFASEQYIALTEARIEVANRLADKEKKPKKERDDTLNILRERQKAELEATKQLQQELIAQGEFTDEKLLRQKFDNSKELLNQEKQDIDEQIALLKTITAEKVKNAKGDAVEIANIKSEARLEELKLDTDKAKIQAELAKDLTDFLIDEEKRRQKELEKIRKQELEDFISDAYEQGALLKIQRAAQARDEMKDAGWNVKKKRSIQLNSAIDMLQIDWDTQQKIIDNDKTSLEEKKRSLEIQKEIEQQFHEDSLNLDVELTKAQIEEWNKRISAMSEISGRVFDIMNTIYDGQLTRIEQLHDYEIASAGDSVEKRIMAERKYEKEKAKIMRKQAIAQKAQTAFEIIINTASAVVEALPNIPLAVIIGALGLSQLALTLAAPIPKFAKGTKNAPETFIAGDSQNSSGASELIMKPDGTAILTPDKPTLFSDKSFVGSTILPADQTQKMLANYAIKQSYDMIDMSESNKHLKRLVENSSKPKRDTFIDTDGRKVIIRGYIKSKIF